MAEEVKNSAVPSVAPMEEEEEEKKEEVDPLQAKINAMQSAMNNMNKAFFENLGIAPKTEETKELSSFERNLLEGLLEAFEGEAASASQPAHRQV